MVASIAKLSRLNWINQCGFWDFYYRRGRGWYGQSSVPGWENAPVLLGKNITEACLSLEKWPATTGRSK